MQVPFYPPVQQLEQFTDAFCKDLILKASGLNELHIVVKSVRSWTMSAQVAETFQVTVTPAAEANTSAMQPSCIRRASPWAVAYACCLLTFLAVCILHKV